jgi:proteasome lid subunit RPN8/RPN11
MHSQLISESAMLSLNAAQRQQIIAHAERTYPDECCGILLGRIDRPTQQKKLIEVIETKNAWSEVAIAALQDISPSLVLSRQPEANSRRDRYWIDPQDLLTAHRRARDQQLQVIGIYHSHPDHPAVPSECDRVLAWAEYSYVIVSVCQRIAVEFQCWCLNEHQQFHSEVTE